MANFVAFRTINVKDEVGHRATIVVPTTASQQDIEVSMKIAEYWAIKAGGAFTEITYQAYTDCIDWFRLKRTRQLTSNVKDFLKRIKWGLKNATKFQQRLADRDFIETYYGNMVGRQIGNIANVRSAVYDVIRKDMGDVPEALDAAFVGCVYVLACYQCSVIEQIADSIFQEFHINWLKAIEPYNIDGVARFADRLLLLEWKFDIVAHKEEINKVCGYALSAMATEAFDKEADVEAVKEAWREIPKEKRKTFGTLRDALESEFGAQYDAFHSSK